MTWLGYWLRCGFSSGGVIRTVAPGGDRVPFVLSGGCGWVPADAVRRYGEAQLRALLDVERIHRIGGPDA